MNKVYFFLFLWACMRFSFLFSEIDNWKMHMAWIMKHKYWIAENGVQLPEPINHIEMADRFFLALPTLDFVDEELQLVREQINYMRALTGKNAERAFNESLAGISRLAWIPDNENALSFVGNAIVARIVKECRARREGKGTI